MADLRRELMDDYNYLSERVRKYLLVMETIKKDDLPPCFVPQVDFDKLFSVTASMDLALQNIEDALEE